MNRSLEMTGQFRRKFKSDAMIAITALATLLALVPLFLVLGYLVSKGRNREGIDLDRQRSNRLRHRS